MPSFFEFKPLKYFSVLFNLLLIVLVFLFYNKVDNMINLNNQRLSEKDNQIKELIKENKQKDIRIDKVLQVVENITNAHPAVGKGVEDVLIDLKENRTFGIDQKINDLPDDMKQIIILDNIEMHGLAKYKLVDDSFIFPVSNKAGYIPSIWGEFGYRPQLFDENYQYIYKPKEKITKWEMHPANDFVNPYNPDVFAVKDGVIKDVGKNKKAGNYIIIQHNKREITRYYHLYEIKVKKGQKVTQGDVIALIGETGKTCIGKHLHFEYLKHNGYRWEYINFLEGTSHNRKWIAGCYWYKIKKQKLLEDGTEKTITQWRVKIL